MVSATCRQRVSAAALAAASRPEAIAPSVEAFPNWSPQAARRPDAQVRRPPLSPGGRSGRVAGTSLVETSRQSDTSTP